MSSLTGHRVEDWWVELLDRNDTPLGRLRGVTGGRLDQNVHAIISGGGTLHLQDLGQDIDWLSARVQPWYSVAGHEPWPLGIFLPSAPTAGYSPTGRRWSVELLDKLAILDQDKVDGSYSLPAGTNVTLAVQEVIMSAGEDRVAITASSETLTSGMVWEAGTSKLRIVNDLLASINYFSLRADGHGRYVAQPYTRPEDRELNWEFLEGARAIHSPDFTRDEDLASVPNKVVLVSSAAIDEPAMVGVATNEDPSSRFSYQSRGRWITHTEDLVEATSQEVLDGLAARKLADLSAATATLSVEHAALPLQLNDAVRFVTAGVETRGVVQKMSQALEVGALTRSTIREVAGQ